MIKKYVLFLLFILFPFLLNAPYFLFNYNKTLEESRKISIQSKIYYLSGKYYPTIADAIYNNVEPKFDNIILSIIWKESRFNRHALSNKYYGNYRDYGLMQISDYWWNFNKNLIFNEDYNIKIGYNIYVQFWKRSEYDIWHSLKYYNGSEVYAHSVINIYYDLTTLNKSKEK